MNPCISLTNAVSLFTEATSATLVHTQGMNARDTDGPQQKSGFWRPKGWGSTLESAFDSGVTIAPKPTHESGGTFPKGTFLLFSGFFCSHLPFFRHRNFTE